MLKRISESVRGDESERSLPCDNGPDSVISAGGFDDEPEQDVSDVDNPDGLSERLELVRCAIRGKKGGRTNAIEVEAITEHQLPETHWLDFKRFDRTKKRETELCVDESERQEQVEN